MGFLKATKFRGEESQARVSAEQNKAVARNSQVGFGTRVRAALRVPGDKRKQRKAKMNAELEQHKART